MNTVINFANSSDNTFEIARLIFETDNIIPFIFGERTVAIPKIKDLVERTDNVFSFQNVLVYKSSEDEIKGLLLFYAPKNLDKKLENQAFTKVFSTRELIVLWFKSLFLKSINDKSAIDGIYIQNISVDSSSRGEGIGTKLMNYVEEYSIRQSINSLWLDVAFDNPKAKKLYERQGFIEMSSHKIMFSNNGFYRMKKTI
jgi:ribosomal protein S18 acetylase RimI-like enzyme